MTKIYCGRCGSSGGVGARYCRICGSELSKQDEPSRPLPQLAPQPVEQTTIAPPIPIPATTPPLMDSSAPAIAHAAEAEPPAMNGQEESPDPVAMLRRLRVSGPLIIEEAMKKQDQMNEIISQALDGLDQSGNQEKGATGKALSPVAAPPPTRTAAMRAPAPVTRPTPNAGTGAGQAPPQGPSRVLANASGFKPGSRLGFHLRIGLILMALFISSISYFVFRDRIMSKPDSADSGRDLMRVEDLSAQHVKRGETEREHGNYEVALGHFQKALSLTPNNPHVLFLVAQTYGQNKQTDEALRSYLDLLRIAPENLEARLQVASIHQNRGNWSSAYREYQRIIALDQNSVQAAVALEAIENYEASQAGESAKLKGTAKPRAPQLAGPILPTPPLVQKEISLQPPRLTSDSLLRPPAALDLSQVGDKPDPVALAEARKDRGLRYLNIREYRAAINELLIALRLTPDDKDIYYFLGSAYYGLQEYAQAYEYYKRVDRGRYVQVSQSGAKRTEKAAEEYRRKMNLPKNDSPNGSPNMLNQRDPKDGERMNPMGKPMVNGYQ